MNVTAAATHYDVIISGAGPVGLTLANLLGQFALRVLVLEKETEFPDQPRAVSLDDECLRIWQQCGLIEQILPFIAQGEEGDTVFTYRSSGGRPLFTMQQHGRPYGYARGNVILYPHILAQLAKGLSRFEGLSYLQGCELTDFTNHDDKVNVTAQDSSVGERKFSCSYLVACDGGRSPIRTKLGIPLEGMAYEESWLIVDTFAADQVDEPLTEGVEVWCDARCPTATIPLPGGYRRWEFLLRQKYHPDPQQCLDDSFIEQMIAERKPQAETKAIRKLVHTYKARMAGQYHQERIFLAGDAAHLSPPFAGQGMATGLRDAANLAWKLAHVVSSRGGVALLDSYAAERRPHQKQMLKLALRMGKMMMPETRFKAHLISLFFFVAGTLPGLRRMLEIRGQNVTPAYPSEDRRRGSRVGQLLPQPQLGDGCLLDERLGADYTLISFAYSPERFLSAQEKIDFEKRGITYLQLGPEGETAEAYQIFDQWLGGCQQRALIVRPDRFICVDLVLPKSGSRNGHR